MFDKVTAAAKRHGVAMHAACVKSGVSYSTVHRAKHGADMAPHTCQRLLAAIHDIVSGRGERPDFDRPDVDITGETPEQIGRRIFRDVRKLVSSAK